MQKGNANILFLILILAFAFLVSRAIDIPKGGTWEKGGNVAIDTSQVASNPNKALQLDTFHAGGVITATPTPTTNQITPTTGPILGVPTLPPSNACVEGINLNRYYPDAPTCSCNNEHGFIAYCKSDGTCDHVLDSSCASMFDAGDRVHDLCHIATEEGYYCLGKPVIYLYPTKKIVVDVEVTMEEGKVVISDPLYDTAFAGWDNVIAYPDGKLTYQGRDYHELYYETAVSNVAQPTTGIVIPKALLKQELTRITTQLGLIKPEQDEFLEYWLPKLHKLHSSYIVFSLVEKTEKDRIDKVTISPKPDTFIEMLVYFKPIEQLTFVAPLQLPTTPPQRIGFTAVEWGGTIDY